MLQVRPLPHPGLSPGRDLEPASSGGRPGSLPQGEMGSLCLKPPDVLRWLPSRREKLTPPWTSGPGPAQEALALTGHHPPPPQCTDHSITVPEERGLELCSAQHDSTCSALLKPLGTRHVALTSLGPNSGSFMGTLALPTLPCGEQRVPCRNGSEGAPGRGLLSPSLPPNRPYLPYNIPDHLPVCLPWR